MTVKAILQYTSIYCMKKLKNVLIQLKSYMCNYLLT